MTAEADHATGIAIRAFLRAATVQANAPARRAPAPPVAEKATRQTFSTAGITQDPLRIDGSFSSGQ
jgi:hypothetical protein